MIMCRFDSGAPQLDGTSRSAFYVPKSKKLFRIHRAPQKRQNRSESSPDEYSGGAFGRAAHSQYSFFIYGATTWD
jgi:hypothetical protein